ncbi:MAG: aspartyl/asparaginyl beta-hydroxylase domain-containing protein [Actinomycetota bacterium]|nr:aspartyl/asparaginyl beta-hydroxylase domain-containing protein [Actinomycetota bacterium]
MTRSTTPLSASSTSPSTTFDPGQLLTALAGIGEDAWSLPSRFTETGVHHGYRRVVLVNNGHHKPHAELFGFVWDAMHPIRDATLSRIDPGGFIAPHRDGGPWQQRWQIPIVASGQWHAQETFNPQPGKAFEARHWEQHAVTNRGDGPRIHLVVDRDIPVDREALPFATFPVPADMADLIERSV